MVDPEATRLSLTAFLLRPTVGPLASLTPTFADLAVLYRWADSSLHPVSHDESPTGAPQNDEDILLALLSKPVGPPTWQHFVQEAFGLEGFVSPVSRSQGAVVFCSAQDPLDGTQRWIVWVFGSGSRALRRGSVDSRFGLLTALNRIAGASGDEPAGLRQFQYQQFGAYRQRTSHRAARDVPVQGFRFDQFTDLLSGAGGTQAESGGHIYGARPIRVREALQSADDLPVLAQQALEDYRDDAYRENEFSFIDDYVLVEEAVTITHLRTELFADLLADRENVDAFIPDDLADTEDDSAIHFVLFPGEQVRAASRLNMTIGGLRKYLENSDEEALDATLRFCDAGKRVIAEASILECLSAELDLETDKYVLSDGSFFQVSETFLSATNSELEEIEVTSLEMPCYRGGKEGEWIASVVEQSGGGVVSIDGQLVKLPGETRFEAADLVHESGTLIHAKRKGRSSALSYLFVQARRSCQLLSQVPAACDQVRDLVAAAAPTAEEGARYRGVLAALDARPPNIEVVLAILGDWRNKTLENLPLLAKLELVETTRDIRLLGYRPTVALVDVCRD
jgi:uncharacterized protein (TIGR04141 family)